MKTKEQLERELQQINDTQPQSPITLLLEQLRITVDKQLPKMDFLFQLFGKPCFPRRELVAVTGKAKSGKTPPSEATPSYICPLIGD